MKHNNKNPGGTTNNLDDLSGSDTDNHIMHNHVENNLNHIISTTIYKNITNSGTGGESGQPNSHPELHKQQKQRYWTDTYDKISNAVADHKRN